jgi:flagellar biosynthetic protein FliO
METAQILSSFAQMLLSLIVVCGLIYLTFRVLLPKISGYQSGNSIIKIVERISLDAKKHLYIVELGGRWMLLSSAENNVNLICELDEMQVAEVEKIIALRSQPQLNSGTFAQKLAEVLKKKG